MGRVNGGVDGGEEQCGGRVCCDRGSMSGLPADRLGEDSRTVEELNRKLTPRQGCGAYLLEEGRGCALPSSRRNPSPLS